MGMEGSKFFWLRSMKFCAFKLLLGLSTCAFVTSLVVHVREGVSVWVCVYVVGKSCFLAFNFSSWWMQEQLA